MTRAPLRALGGAAVAWGAAVLFGLAATGFAGLDRASDRFWLLAGSLGLAALTGAGAGVVRGGAWARAAFCIPLGVGVGLVWTAVANLLTGGYLPAAAFPLFWCWCVGAVLGLLAAVLPATRRGLAAGLAAGGLVAAVVGREWYRGARPVLALEVQARPDATPADVQRIWSHVLADPEPTGTGYRPLPGLGAMRSLGSQGGAERIAVLFDVRASAADSARVADRLRAAPQVAAARWARMAR